MNRKKKINQTFKKKAKMANAKRNPKPGERYISKAERAKLEAAETVQEKPLEASS